ncbi:ParA family protein [Rubrivirga sp.]|uniref:ParA family protein n=1 Tax=Rubrivirga sp. TaxID=1885344 RepID=UPI003B52DF0A
MTVLCYHHKGGVGKSTTAVHVALTLLDDGSVLVIDGDTQAHSCAFFGVPPAAAEDGPVAVPAAGALWVAHAENSRLRRLPKQVGADHVVVDLSADFERMARVATTLPPDLVLLCTKPHTGALRDLPAVVNALVRETTAEVRVVPIGVDPAEIDAALAAFPAGSYVVADPVSYVPDEAERSFEERRPVWDFPTCTALRAEYDALTDP